MCLSLMLQMFRSSVSPIRVVFYFRIAFPLPRSAGDSAKSSSGVGVSLDALLAVESVAVAPQDVALIVEQSNRSAEENDAVECGDGMEMLSLSTVCVPAPSKEYARQMRENMFLQVM